MAVSSDAPGTPFGVVSQAWHLAESHGDWMAWNLGLALVPLLLAAVLFRRDRARPWLWWVGVGVFVAFLPNAPYVLTDVIHLFTDIRGTSSDLLLLGVHVPLYLFFFAIGFGSYVAALELARRYTRSAAPGQPWWPIETGLHLLCAVGVYLGRVVRLNSWEILTRPRAVVAGVSWLAGVAPAALVLCTAVVLAALTMAVRILAWGTADAVAQIRLPVWVPRWRGWGSTT